MRSVINANFVTQCLGHMGHVRFVGLQRIVLIVIVIVKNGNYKFS
jgi:hypothetical protein